MTRMVELMAWIAQSQGLSAAEIATHKDFSQQTVCPGKNLEPYVRSGRSKGSCGRGEGRNDQGEHLAVGTIRRG